MVNYQNSKIYRLICSETNKQYIGSTVQPLSSRIRGHKCKSNNPCISKTLVNPSIILIINYPCNSKEELLRKEREYIENMECINLRMPHRTKEQKKEYDKEFRKTEKSKKWREEYKTTRKEVRDLKNKEKFKCECGSTINFLEQTRHKKSKKHLTYLDSI